MLTQPFLTELDSRAAVKGSVDPLGLQAIWTYFGRLVVGNLTTVSSSTADFTILLVGYHLAEQVAELGGPEDFSRCLMWEQLASYARAHILGETGFRGTTRTRKFLAEGTRVTLSAEQAHQTLASQKTYGIFGLYTNPARTSGLLDADRPLLSPTGREIVERLLLPRLVHGVRRDAAALARRLLDDAVSIHLNGRDATLAQAVAHLLAAHQDDRAVQAAYREHLVFGGPNDRTGGRQRELALAFSDTFEEDEYGLAPQRLRDLVDAATRSGHSELAEQLDAIRICESALAPFAAMFGFLLQRDAVTPAEVGTELRDAWGSGAGMVEAAGFERLEGLVVSATGSDTTATRLVEAARSLRDGHYEDAVHLLLEQNEWIMEARGGAPWVEVRKGKLHVRLRYDEGNLPSREQLPKVWRHAYFLESLRNVGREVGVA